MQARYTPFSDQYIQTHLALSSNSQLKVASDGGPTILSGTRLETLLFAPALQLFSIGPFKNDDLLIFD